MRVFKYVVAFVAVVSFNADAALGIGVGLNKFDLVKQYTGTASGGDGASRYRKVTRAMGRKSIADARDLGVSYLRISATGYFPSAYGRSGDLDLWIENPRAYWELIDELIGDLEALGMRGVFTFIWNPVQFPSMTGETVHDLLTNPNSRSYQMAERYLREFVQRYKNRKAILFYELTNELNLGADLDMVARCRKETSLPLCEPKSNYTTAEMIGFTRRLAELISGLDPAHPISSGFSAPRPAAEHLRAKPEWVSGKAGFAPDSIEQLEKNLADIHEGVDLISVHLYPKQSNRRFGAKGVRSTDLLDIVKKAADKIGKPLFVGEFGDAEKLDGAADSFTVRMLDRIVALKVPYSAVWVWEFYQRAPYLTRDDPEKAYSLEPGATDQLNTKIRKANEIMGNTPPHREGADRVPPRVVLTWPLECTLIRDSQPLYAVASDESGKVRAVEFWLDNQFLGSDGAPPYEAIMKAERLRAGEHNLIARAHDAAGNIAEYRTVVVVGKSSPGAPCSMLMH